MFFTLNGHVILLRVVSDGTSILSCFLILAAYTYVLMFRPGARASGYLLLLYITMAIVVSSFMTTLVLDLPTAYLPWGKYEESLRIGIAIVVAIAAIIVVVVMPQELHRREEQARRLRESTEQLTQAVEKIASLNRRLHGSILMLPDHVFLENQQMIEGAIQALKKEAGLG